ncbi:lytic transglycosylase domain-containing protein [Nocardia puris]|uniref:Transglycosylase-like protein with SLT domain n=1 Tax=Nocardia puris TaxID=208602 RepID=A0A366DAD8_9NOCA|nr:transglycosylase SLT domain-containing protein [Nocardia puris]RBO87022.1 transglycosylase-like protein with SLT domain [Nocardia puris]
MPTYSAGSASVEIKPDFRGFVQDLREDLEKVEARLGIEINPDMAGFTEALYTKLREIEAGLDPLDIELNPEVTNFIIKLETELEKIRADLNVELGVTEAAYEKLQADIEKRLTAMRFSVEVRVSANTKMAASELAALQAAYKRMTMRVDADTAAAAAQIAALNRRNITVGVRANRSNLAGMFGPVGLNVGVLGLSALPAAATAVASIGADLQGILQSAVALPGMFAGAAAAVSVLSVGLDGLGDALSDKPEKAAEAYAKLGAEGRAIVDTAKSFSGEWDRISALISSTTLAGLDQPLGDLLTNQLPVLERGMQSVAGEFNGLFRTLLSEAGNQESQDTLSRIFGNTAESVGILETGIDGVVGSLRTLTGTGSAVLPRLAQGFADAANRFDAFLQRADDSGDLSRWIDEGITAVDRFVSVLGNLGAIFASVFRAVRGETDGFLATTDKLTEGWASWLKSTEGQAELRLFFRDAREQMDQWQPVLSSIGEILGTVMEAAQTWSAILLPFLNVAADLLGEHDSILKAVLISWLAYKTLAPIFLGLQSAVASTTQHLHKFQAGAAAAGGAAGAGALSRAIGGIGAMLGPAGWVTLAISAAAIGIGLLATRHQEAAAAADEQRRKLEQLRETLNKHTGAVTDETIASTTKDLETRGLLEQAETLGVDPREYVRAGLGLDPDARTGINNRITDIIVGEEQARGFSSWWELARRQSGLNDEQIAQALQGIPSAVEQYAQSGTTIDLAELKRTLTDTADSAATLGGEMNGLETATGQAGEAARRINATLNGTFRLTDEGAQRFEALGLAVMSVPDARTVQIKLTDEQQRDFDSLRTRLEEFGYKIERLPNGTATIVLEDEAARAAIAEITKPATKPVTITYTGEFNKPEGMRQPIPRALGGSILGGIPGRDSVPILAMPGEHMLDTTDVARLGGQQGVYRFRAALKAGLVRPMATGGAVEWTDQNEIDLQQAQNAITRAEEKQTRVNANPKSTEADKRAAALAVEEARLKAQKLENRKSGIAGGPDATVLPQAPLPGRRSNEDLDQEDAQARVDQANTKRNQVYNDPNSTPEQKSAADRDYQRAQNAYEESLKSGSGKGGSDGLPEEYSLQGIFSRAGGILAEGLLSFFGLENSILSSSNVYNRGINAAIDHFTGQQGEDTTSSGEGYAYEPKNLPTTSSDTESSSSTGDSSSSDASSAVPEYSPAGGVEQWRGLFAQVLSALSMPASWLDLGLAQMRTESGGNPKAINLWDINAKNGTPSKGLMQVIDPTFAANRSALYPNDIWHPAANIAASLRYTVGRYGSPVGVWGQGHGYDQGGIANGIGLMLKQTIRPERVLSPRQTEVFESALPLLESIRGAIGTPAPAPPAWQPSTGQQTGPAARDHSVNFHGPVSVMDMHELVREQDRWTGMQAQGALAVYG